MTQREYEELHNLLTQASKSDDVEYLSELDKAFEAVKDYILDKID